LGLFSPSCTTRNNKRTYHELNRVSLNEASNGSRGLVAAPPPRTPPSSSNRSRQRSRFFSPSFPWLISSARRYSNRAARPSATQASATQASATQASATQASATQASASIQYAGGEDDSVSSPIIPRLVSEQQDEAT